MHEGLEDALDLPGRDARALVGHADADLAGRRGLPGQIDATVEGRELDRVGEHVAHLGTGITHTIPKATEVKDGEASYRKSLAYMNFEEGQPLLGKKIDYVFLGSCTNGRIEDFRAFAKVVKGRKKADNITAWLVPGSHIVEEQIKKEGILDILNEAGFELRQPGCSACLAMNDDKIPAGKYAVSTSNRNFEGRQGPGARTLLASPYVAAAVAVTGVVTDPRELLAEG